MTGHTVRICPPRDFDFSNLGGSPASLTVTLEERIGAAQYDELDLIVRVHSATIGTDATVTVQVVSDGYTDDDPATEFFSSPIGSVQLDDTAAAGDLEVTSITSKLGSMVAVQVIGAQASNPVSMLTRLSIDLALKQS